MRIINCYGSINKYHERLHLYINKFHLSVCLIVLGRQPVLVEEEDFIIIH